MMMNLDNALNMTISEPIKEGDIMLYAAGTQVTPTVIKLLHKRNFTHVPVIIDGLKHTVEDKTVMDAIRAQSAFNFNVKNNTPFEKKVDNVNNAVNEIIDNINNSNEFQMDLLPCVRGEKIDAEKYVSDVTAVAINISKHLNTVFPRDEKIDLNEVGQVALLSDIGRYYRHYPAELEKLIDESKTSLNVLRTSSIKFDVPSDIVLKKYDEKYHAIYSYLELNNLAPNAILNSKVKQAILLSHDNYAGTSGLKVCLDDRMNNNKSVARMAQIVRLASKFIIRLYDGHNLNPYEPFSKVQELLDKLMTPTYRGKCEVEPVIVNSLIVSTPLYPKDTRIMLNDGRTGTVLIQNPKLEPKRIDSPILKLDEIDPKTGKSVLMAIDPNSRIKIKVPLKDDVIEDILNKEDSTPVKGR